jgi:hypothetical protein
MKPQPVTLESLDQRLTHVEQLLTDSFTVLKYVLGFLSVVASGILIALVTMH